MSEQQVANNGLEANVIGYGVSYAVTSVLSALLVVLKESTPAVHDLLVAITGHHWVSHGLINIILFLVLGFILTKRDVEMSISALVKTIVGTTVLSGLIIMGYFI